MSYRLLFVYFFFFKQKTAYEMRISDWSSDVCSSDLWPGQPAYEFVFGNSWRIVIASMTAFWAGEFANSYVLARMKIWTGGRHLWMRTIGSTVVGQGLDSLIFYPLAFYGLAGWPPEQLYEVVLSQWFKIGRAHV